MITLDFRCQAGDFTLRVDAALPAAGVTAIIGRSGAGKTTLVHAVAGAVRPASGRIVVGDLVFFDAGRGIDLAPQARAIGYVFQDSRLFPHLSVRDNLRYGQVRARRRGRDAGIDEARVVDLLGIGALLHRRPHALSGGERQRVAIGRALLAQPRLLLMDEPLASLDAERKAEILPYLERLRAEIALPVLYISHAIDEAIRLADHMLVLEAGAVSRQGPLATLMSDPAMSRWLGRAESGAVLDCVVRRHDDALLSTTLDCADGLLYLPQIAAPVGARVRLRLRARDVALAVSPPEGLSISNQLAGVVSDMAVLDDGHADVGVALPSGAVVRALVMRESAARLDLAPGRRVWALIKAAAIAGGHAQPG